MVITQSLTRLFFRGFGTLLSAERLDLEAGQSRPEILRLRPDGHRWPEALLRLPLLQRGRAQRPGKKLLRTKEII